MAKSATQGAQIANLITASVGAIGAVATAALVTYLGYKAYSGAKTVEKAVGAAANAVKDTAGTAAAGIADAVTHPIPLHEELKTTSGGTIMSMAGKVVTKAASSAWDALKYITGIGQGTAQETKAAETAAAKVWGAGSGASTVQYVPEGMSRQEAQALTNQMVMGTLGLQTEYDSARDNFGKVMDSVQSLSTGGNGIGLQDNTGLQKVMDQVMPEVFKPATQTGRGIDEDSNYDDLDFSSWNF